MTHVTFPSTKWRDDPVGYFRDVLGVEPWWKQIEVINAIRDHKRVAVKSGHKVSKSHTAAGVGLWFYDSFDDARVVMTSTTARQVDDILWRETRMMKARSGYCVACKAENDRRGELRAEGELIEPLPRPCIHSAEVDGVIGELARTGLKSEDFREIKGFTAREAEAVAGMSGRNLLYIVDEASGIKPEIFEAIEGNRAGGARIVLFSNPTRTSGEFYDAFNSKARFYSLHTISSEETPNVVHGDDDERAIPGLASREWVEEKKEEWGEDSPLYKVRVKGEFAELEEGKIFSVHAIAESEERWADSIGIGRLCIGLDPAGEGPMADESVWAPRRGDKHLAIIAKRGLSYESLLMHTLGICKEFGHPREVPVVMMDREGKVGSEAYGTFVAFLADEEKKGNEPSFELIPVRASDRAHRKPVVFDRVRDEMAAVLIDWMRDGGAIVPDAKLAKELHAFEWRELINGRVKITPKNDVKKLLKRSPDRYDALVLSCYVPSYVREGLAAVRKSTIGDRPDHPIPMDPYAGSEAADPYAS